MDYIYKNIEEYNPNKKRKMLLIFDDVNTYMLTNKKFNPVVTELFIRGRKSNISLVSFDEILFCCTKKSYTKFHALFYYKIFKQRELQQTAYNHSSDIDFKDFMNLYKKCNAKQYPFLVINVTLGSDNPSCFRKSPLERKNTTTNTDNLW